MRVSVLATSVVIKRGGVEINSFALRIGWGTINKAAES